MIKHFILNMKCGKYKLVKAPKDYPGTKYRLNKYCYEHHLIWWQNTGEIITSKYCLHHINEKPRDNRFENLKKITRKEHSSMHNSLRGILMCILKCPNCGIIFKRDKRKTYLICPNKATFCSRFCAGKFYTNNNTLNQNMDAYLIKIYRKMPRYRSGEADMAVNHG